MRKRKRRRKQMRSGEEGVETGEEKMGYRLKIEKEGGEGAEKK